MDFLSFFTGKRQLEADHLKLGRRGEEVAVRFLKEHGYEIVALNFIARLGRSKTGHLLSSEIDIVAYDGNILSFIEVKTRRSDLFRSPEEAVDMVKQRQISRAAKRYRQIFRLSGRPYRFDV